MSNPVPAAFLVSTPSTSPIGLMRPSAPTDNELSAAIQLIGKPRLDAYKTFFGCRSEIELIGAYLWGQAIAGALQPIVSTYEVILRNAVHKHASILSSNGLSDSYPWYDPMRGDALPTKGKSRGKIDDLLYELRSNQETRMRKASQPSPDQVVASLSFGFWPNFLQGLTNTQRQKILHRVFSHYPKGSERHWSFDKNVSILIGGLKKIQDLRNRIAHYTF